MRDRSEREPAAKPGEGGGRAQAVTATAAWAAEGRIGLLEREGGGGGAIPTLPGGGEAGSGAAAAFSSRPPPLGGERSEASRYCPPRGRLGAC